jgi:hypothetical protein
MPGIDASAPVGWVAGECTPDGWVAGASVALCVGVPATAGESADRMPGIEGWVSDAREPGAFPVAGCSAGLWLPAPPGAAAWDWLDVRESNRYRLYSFISAMRFAPYSGSVA